MITILVDAAGSAQVLRQLRLPVSTQMPPWMIPSHDKPDPTPPTVLQ